MRIRSGTSGETWMILTRVFWNGVSERTAAIVMSTP
jgi:hypothetical protein